MKEFVCPSCGAAVPFRSSASVFSVCAYCHSTLVRRDVEIEMLGKMADLKSDATTFQIGTTGEYAKHGFILLGRVRIDWEAGFWNEWYARFNDGRDGWLAEAQGFYMMSFAAATPPVLPAADAVKTGQVITIEKIPYVVDDIKSVTYAFSEGELPFVAAQGVRGTSVDLQHGEGDFASISYGADGSVDVFTGRYLEFADFKFQNLKVIDGW